MGTMSELSYLQALLEGFKTDQGRDLQPSSQLELTTYLCNAFIAVCGLDCKSLTSTGSRFLNIVPSESGTVSHT